MKDALYWAEKMRKKIISPTEYHKEVAQRIKQKNQALNAYVEVRASETRNPSLMETQPFYGIPIPLKVLGQTKKGMLDSSSSRLFAKHQASSTDNFVKKLEELGFLPFGKTNAPEFGFKNITDPQLYGVTKNPWNLDYHVGGSSGGAAAAVASGIVPIAGASDGGGSIRIPASFAGLVGLKPTRGSMPVGPSGWRGWQGASINFALTVSMRDTQTLFEAMRTVQKQAPYQAPFYTQKTTPEKKTLRIAYCTASPVAMPVSIEAEQATKQAIHFLEKQGHQVVEISLPYDGIALMDSYYQMNGAETAAMMENIERGLGRKVTKKDMEPMTWAIYQYGRTISGSQYSRLLQLWDQATVQMEAVFQAFDLFLTPTTADHAPLIAQDLQSATIRELIAHAEELSAVERQVLVAEMFAKSLAITPYTQIANLTGEPAISLPTYITEKGLPLGIQFMASKGREDLLFQIGKEFEAQHQFCLPNTY